MELLVVIAIIGILIAVVIPVIGTALERGRQADCVSNLRQFAVMIMTYRTDRQNMRQFGADDYRLDVPPWLSSLYGDYHASKSIYVCRSDRSGGADGSRPDTGPEDVIRDQFAETDDTESNTSAASLAAGARRNAQVTRCSYMYEFSAAACSWGWQGYLGGVTGAEIDRDGDPSHTSWGEAKYRQMYGGDGWNGFQPYGETYFPIVRCFHHYRVRVTAADVDPSGGLLNTTHKEPLSLNVAYAGNVFPAPLTWELVR